MVPTSLSILKSSAAFRWTVGVGVATVVALGLEAYAGA